MAFDLTGLTLDDWKALKGSQQRALLITVIGATITAVITYIYGGTSTQSFISLTLSVAVALFMDRVARYRFENKTEVDLGKYVSKDDSLVCIGGTEQGVNWFRQHSSGLDAVTNTVINRSEVRHNPIHRVITPRFIAEATRLINGGCVWTDICLPSQKIELEGFAARLSARGRENYEIVCVDPNVPVLQCLLMKFRDGRKEVLFGWGQAGTDKSMVFHSGSRDTTEYFEYYCANLGGRTPSRPPALHNGGLVTAPADTPA